jgi:hypothetical protein
VRQWRAQSADGGDDCARRFTIVRRSNELAEIVNGALDRVGVRLKGGVGVDERADVGAFEFRGRTLQSQIGGRNIPPDSDVRLASIALRRSIEGGDDVLAPNGVERDLVAAARAAEASLSE